MASLGLLHQILGQTLLGTESEEGEEVRWTVLAVLQDLQLRRQEAQDGLHLRPAQEAETRVHGQQIPDGGEEEEPLCGAGTEREPAEDLVPEQEGQAQEVHWREGRAGQDAGDSGTLQSQHNVR